MPPNSVYTWADLEQKFHDYFFIGETELKLSHLTSVKQKLHEGVPEYIRRFGDIRNQCYRLTISDRDLVDIAFAGLLDFHKEKLDGQKFPDVSRVQPRQIRGDLKLDALQRSLARTVDAKDTIQLILN